MARILVPVVVRRWLREQQKGLRRLKQIGKTRGELLEQIHPLSRRFGLDRGIAIDRYYIERFISQHSLDIRGHVLEIGDSTYVTMFGSDQVRHVDILHPEPGNPRATIVADLAAADSIPSETFDCIILTQTLQFIYDLSSAVRHVHRILKIGGTVLVTVPGISQISQYEMERWGDYWRFTTSSVSRLFGSQFPKSKLEVSAYGNALVASAFLHGLVAEELLKEELALHDPEYQVLISLRGTRQ